MRTSVKLGLTGVLAAILLVAAIGTASARNLEVSNQGFLASWSRLEFQSNIATVRCQLTLDGSFHSRTIAKIARALIGHITEVRIKRESCTGGEMLIENSSLPWHLTYEGFTGTLPNITSWLLLLQRYLIRINIGGILCFFGTATDNTTWRANIAAGEITELTPVAGRNVLNLLEGGLFCPRTKNFVAGGGDGRVSVLNAWTTRIRIRLI